MADNIAVTAGTGTNIAADDVGGVLVQRVKVTWGPDGTANDVDDATGKRLPVEVAEPLPAGTNAIGKLAANSGVDIGDVDVLSIAAGDNNIGNVDIVTVPAPLSTTGGGTEATALRVTLASDSTGVVSIDDNGGAITVDGTVTANLAAGTNNIGDVDVLSIAAGENVIGLVGASDIKVAVTPTCDTSAYTAGDALFDKTEIAAAARVSGGVTILQSITVLDKDDQAAAGMDIYFFDSTLTFGTANSAPSISDADAAKYQGHVSIATADWKDLGGCKVACKTGIGLAMKPTATSLWFAATTAGTPTQSASGLVFGFTFLRS